MSKQKDHLGGLSQHPLSATRSDGAGAQQQGGSSTAPGAATGDQPGRSEGATPAETPLPSPDPALPSHDEELSK